jgi:chemotaxis protein histidine kinase CheA/ActR/RegA family two-component response regulator
MQPEQQRILGYFIEEAKEHLATIENALLNLQTVVDDPELMSEVFRAAHSVKGGAAMLGIHSMQHIAHRLEDYFKVLRENPVRVDQHLESLFFKGFDVLNSLTEELEQSFVLTDERTQQTIHDLEPVFMEIQTHLGQLTGTEIESEPLTFQPQAQATKVEEVLPVGSGAAEADIDWLGLFTEDESALVSAEKEVAEVATGDSFWDELLQEPTPVEANAAQAAERELVSQASSLESLLSATAPPSSTENFPETVDVEGIPSPAIAEGVSIPTPIVPPAPAAPRPVAAPVAAPAAARRNAGAQNMKVAVKQLDTLSNLIGELVVNRNSLEDNQDRMRQFLANLLLQVQQLNELGQKMQDLYERSLLEGSLVAARAASGRGGNASNGGGDSSEQHASGFSFDALEMDSFTGFHSLSQEMIERIVRVREAASDIEFVVDANEQVTRMFRQVTTQVQEGLNKARMVPFSQIAERLPRAVRDISLKCGKQTKLELEGQDTLIDKGILERIYDPLTHLVNNAIYHGIETPDIRQGRGKQPEGTIRIRAFYQGNQTVISIADDGAGIDVERVKAKGIERRLITPEEAVQMSRQDAYNLLFQSGFSTNDVADDLAGRGVGMDVVRSSITDIRGVINTDSTVQKGTTFTIRLPLTLSITKALCCLNAGQSIAFPMDGVEDMMDLSKEQLIHREDGQTYIFWRDHQVVCKPLSTLLPFNRILKRSGRYQSAQSADQISVVLLRSGDDVVAVQIDEVVGEQEIVIKQLSGPVPKPLGIAGVTVQGDGRVMPIGDVLELVELSLDRIERGHQFWANIPDPAAEAQTEPMVLIVDDSITVRELLSMTFSKAGYRVEQARDGQEAWEKLRSGLPCELVFCDVEMPRMDGLELLSRIQQDADLQDLPVAMLTSRGASKHKKMATDLGAKGYFTKPYLEEVLLDAAQRMLNGEVLVK